MTGPLPATDTRQACSIAASSAPPRSSARRLDSSVANRQLRRLIVRGEPHPVAAAAERAGDTGDDADHSIRADDPPFLGRRVVLAADRIEFEVFPEAADPMAWTLWSRHLRHDPSAPGWADRDRFVLSAGHGSALLYGLLHIFGYDLPEAELRSSASSAPRRPAIRSTGTPGVECTTGPLGQGRPPALTQGVCLSANCPATRSSSILWPVAESRCADCVAFQ